MDPSLTPDQRSTLQDYAAGRLGTSRAIERLGLQDYADLVIALAQEDLAMPKPRQTAAHAAHLARAAAILQPRLRQGD